jgi:hypothetical protein
MKSRIHTSSLAVFATLVLVLGFAGCAKDDQFDGPSLVDIFGEFSVLTPFAVNTNNVNFAEGGSVVFTALFSKQVNWTVTITGEQSGAQRIISGFSNELTGSNARWNGSTTNLPMFRAENCTATLTIAGEEASFTETITIEAAKVNNGLLLADFEDGFPAEWNTFVQSGANMSFVVTDTEAAGQGSRYYDMGGEVNWDYLIGLFDIPGAAYGDEATFPLSPNPGNVYFNTLLYNPAGINNAITLIQFREDDNMNGTYEAGEDMWSIEITGQEPGWQLISRRYSDIPTLVNGQPSPALGNGIYEPHKLIQVSVLFLANPVTGYSQNYIDYLIFTENAPLQP